MYSAWLCPSFEMGEPVDIRHELNPICCEHVEERRFLVIAVGIFRIARQAKPIEAFCRIRLDSRESRRRLMTCGSVVAFQRQPISHGDCALARSIQDQETKSRTRHSVRTACQTNPWQDSKCHCRRLSQFASESSRLCRPVLHRHRLPCTRGLPAAIASQAKP